LLDSIDISTPIVLRDRALVALMVYSSARIDAALRPPTWGNKPNEVEKIGI
jgi:hypothetical protein